MGYKQTPTHRFGKGSYHQIGLVRGQFGNVPMDQWLKFVQDTGFDGWEEASWELDLDRWARRGPPTRPGAIRAISRRAPIPITCPMRSAG